MEFNKVITQKNIFKILAYLYLIGLTPSFVCSQDIVKQNIDSVIYFRSRLDWPNYHNQINKIIVKENAIMQDYSIINLITKESRLLNEINQGIESSYLWNYIGKLYAITGNFEKAIPYYGRAIEGLSELNDTTYLHLVLYYHSQVIILGTNDPANALASSTEALRLYKKRKDVSQYILGKLHYAQGWSYRGLHEYDKAIESFSKSIELNKDEDGYVETFLCRTYLEMGNFEKALASANVANKKYESIYNERNNEYVLLIGRAKSGLKKYYEAEKIIKNSIHLGKSSYDKHHSEYIKLYYFLAETQFNAGKFDEAISSIQTIFDLSLPGTDDQGNSYNRIRSPFPNLWVLDGLILLGQINISKYNVSRDSLDLILALESFDKSIEDVHLRRAEMNSWKSKQEFNKYAYSAFEGAIEASYLLYKESGNLRVLNKMLNYMEASRSILLKSYQHEMEFQHSVLSIGQREILSSIKKEIAEVEKAYYIAVDANSTTDIEILNKELMEKRKEWKDLIKPFSEYVSQSETKTIRSGISTADIQNHLTDTSVLIMFYELKNKILSVIITKKQTFTDEIDNTVEFSNKLVELYTALSDWENIHKSYNLISEIYKENASFLGHKLLDKLNYIDQNFHKLIVIPHGKLFSIPFEALLLDNELLIEKASIQYALACDQILEDKESNSNGLELFGGFAPSYDNLNNELNEIQKTNIVLRENLIDLPGTRTTLLYLSNKFKGEIWLNKKATKEAFLKNANRFKLLHLGMHGQVHKDESNLSKLYFDSKEESNLSVGEIQSLDLKTEMIVLSACQTNVGIIKKGEGPLSLAYAFLYAGSKSILSSLWSVPDVQTSQIMVSFYDYLEKGLQKSEALRKAKLDYLKTAVGIERHPSYWAGFIIIGNDQPIFADKPSNYLFIITSSILLFGLLYFIRRIRFKK